MALEGGVSNLGDNIVRQVQYIIETKGAQGLVDLQAQLARVNAAEAQLTAQYNAGQITLATYRKGVDSLVAAQFELEGAVKLASEAIATGVPVTDKLVAKLRAQENAARGSAHAMIQVAYAMDDVQYGIPALTNNIAAVAMAFGGGSAAAARWAMGITGAVLAFKAWQNADHIIKAVNSVILAGIPTTQSAADVMEELGKKTHKTAEETERYNKAKKEQKAIEDAIAIQSTAAKEQEGAVQRAIADAGGGGKVIGQLAGVLANKTNLFQDPAFEEKLANARKNAADTQEGRRARTPEEMDRVVEAYTQKVKDDYQASKNKKAGEAAAKIVAEAQTDPTQLGVLEGYVKKNLDSFDKGLAKALEDAKPENIAGAKAAKKKAEDFVKDTTDSIYQAMIDSAAGGHNMTDQEARKRIEEANGGPIADDVFKKIMEGTSKKWDEERAAKGTKEGLTKTQAGDKIIADRKEELEREKKKDASDMDRLASKLHPGFLKSSLQGKELNFDEMRRQAETMSGKKLTNQEFETFKTSVAAKKQEAIAAKINEMGPGTTPEQAIEAMRKEQQIIDEREQISAEKGTPKEQEEARKKRTQAGQSAASFARRNKEKLQKRMRERKGEDAGSVDADLKKQITETFTAEMGPELAAEMAEKVVRSARDTREADVDRKANRERVIREKAKYSTSKGGSGKGINVGSAAREQAAFERTMTASISGGDQSTSGDMAADIRRMADGIDRLHTKGINLLS